MNNLHQNNGDDDVDAMDLGTHFAIELGPLIRGEMPYSVQDLRRAMVGSTSANTNGNSTSLTHLAIHFYRFDPMRDPRNDHQGFVEFLLHYIRSRTHLLKLSLFDGGARNTRADLEPWLRQFLMAAAQSQSIHHLCLCNIKGFPVESLDGFCCAANRNNGVKVLEMRYVDMCSRDYSMVELSETICLDKLILDSVLFDDKWSSFRFKDIAKHLKTTTLELSVGPIDKPLVQMVSNLMASPVKRLHLHQNCNSKLYKTVLKSGKDDVEELTVELGPGLWRRGAKKFELLRKNLPGKLIVLRIVFTDHVSIALRARKKLLRAIDACATLRELQVDDRHNNVFSREEMQLLEDGRSERNRSLHRFLQTPSQLSQKELLALMLQLENCPTGRYELVRKLPEADFF